jgi:hypothetical protein
MLSHLFSRLNVKDLIRISQADYPVTQHQENISQANENQYLDKIILMHRAPS